jgi:mannose/fructose/N-acetylgalactosamine-specific phosphotransferase system component IIC
MNQILKNRILSFIWRAGDIMVVAGINFLAANLGYFNLPVVYVTFIGLVLGEVTKYLNTQVEQPLP